MRAHVGSLVLVFVLAATATPAWADASGSFTLTTVSAATTRVLAVTKGADGNYSGTLTINGTVTPVSALLSSTDITFGGAYTTDPTQKFEVERGVDSVNYFGIVNGRLLAVNANLGTKKVVYDGLVSMFDDLAGKSDDDKLTLFWGKSKLTLVPEADPGSCTGVVKSEGNITTTVFCETSGGLSDGFFNNPEMVILWLMNELIP